MAAATSFHVPGFDRVMVLSSRIETAPTLNEQETGFLDQVKALSLATILDAGEGEKHCKAIGQEIFDHFKALANGDSKAGIEAMRKIADSLPFQCEDGRERKEHVIRAWDRVGDAHEYWMH
ncbi:MAG: hypothetical protein KF898_05285 [Parachlamydiales bacterium]|nr:hypothetical protein [Verrucomicrobiota bacterium]MBX3719042.1 hypothetical protein [Candidatus Acheromyda pituitae]